MSVVTEYEAKLLEIDPDLVAAKIERSGGAHVADRVMRRYVYDLDPGDGSRWIRLRDTGDESTLCVKQIVADTVDGVREAEVGVSDFEATNALLAMLGFTPKAYQENRRSSWMLDGVRLEIDSWPLIPPYLEIEGDCVAQVHETAQRLGFRVQDLDGVPPSGVAAIMAFPQVERTSRWHRSRSISRIVKPAVTATAAGGAAGELEPKIAADKIPLHHSAGHDLL